MKKAYLKGYYGYKNFGDEIMLFGISDFLVNHYNINNLTIEVGDFEWIHRRQKLNRKLNIIPEKVENAINIVPIQQHKRKQLTHLLNILGLGKYSNYFTIFGGGEVLCDERSFPHDGRNFVLLNLRNIIKKNFSIVGGISKPRFLRTKLLYNILIKRAKEIIVRDTYSAQLASNISHQNNSDKLVFSNIILKDDFSLPIFKYIDNKYLQDTKVQKIILINISAGAYKPDNIRKIKVLCQKNPDCRHIFFPCDMNDDINYYRLLHDEIPSLELYEWHRNSLDETVRLFKSAQTGIGSRLHFLLPFKYFKKPFQAIVHTHKVQKLLG